MKKDDGQWIMPAILAILFFMINNVVSSVVTTEIDGISCIFYLSAGGAISGIIFNLRKIFENY